MTASSDVALQSFHEHFTLGRDAFAARDDAACDIVKTHVSTMTFTSRLGNIRDLSTLHEYLTSIRPTEDLRDERGLLAVPRIEQSRFSKTAVDIVPLSGGLLEKVRVRVFCTTGSILVTGCTSHVQCLVALEEVTRLITCPLFPNPMCSVPQCRLINANCALGYTLNISTVVRLCKEERRIRLVELPERHSVTIVHFTDGTKVMVYGSGKFSIHGNAFDALSAARHICLPIFRASRGLPM